MSEPRALVEHFFRHEFGRLGAVLTRSLGIRRLDLVEDVSPLNSLNRAVAEAYLHGPQAGLERLAPVLPENVPARYPGWHVVIGELHFRLGRHSAAERAWREALRFTTARADREFLRRRLAVYRPEGGEPATE
jgi:predicted RNA polymerase sigma factor